MKFRIPRFLGTVLLAIVFILGFTIFSPADTFAREINCDAEQEHPDCSGYESSISRGTLGATFSGNITTATVEPGASVTVLASDGFGGTRSNTTTCPAYSHQGAYYISGGWSVPSSLYTTERAAGFSSNVSYQGALATRADWNGDGFVDSNDAIRGWSYGGGGITPVFTGETHSSGNLAQGRNGWTYGGSSHSWSFSAPQTPGRYSITVASAAHILETYGLQCNSSHYYTKGSLSGAEYRFLTLIVEDTSTPDPVASVTVQSVNDAGAPVGSPSSSVTVAAKGSGNNIQFNTSCSDSSAGLLNVPGKYDDRVALATDTKQFNVNNNGTATLTCQNGAGASDTDTASYTVQPASACQITSFTVNRVASLSNASPGQRLTMQWTSSNCAGSLTAGGSWSGSKALNNTSSNERVTAPSTPGTYSYTLQGSNSVGTASATVSVNVTVPGACTLDLSGPTSAQAGSSIALSWSSTNANGSLSASGVSGWSGSKNTSGSQTVTAPSSAGTYTYSLAGSGSGGNCSDTHAVTVTAQPSATITVTHSGSSDEASETYSISPSVISNRSISRGETHTYTVAPASGGTSYSVMPVATYNGPYISINGDAPQNRNIRSIVLSNGQTANFEFYYQNPTPVAGCSIDSFTANSSREITVSPSERITLAWTSTGDSNGRLSGSGPSPWNGRDVSEDSSLAVSAPSSDGNYTYAIACVGDNGTTVSDSVIVHVSDPQATIVVQTTDFTTRYTLADSDGDYSSTQTISWNSSGVSHTVAPSGGTESYTLTLVPKQGYRQVVTNSTGSGGATASVSAGNTITYSIDHQPLDGTCALTSSTTEVQEGNTFTLTWESNNMSWISGTGAWSGAKNPTSGGSETITAPNVQSGNADSVRYSINCGKYGGEIVSEYVDITVTKAPVPATIQVTSNRDTSFSISPSVASGQTVRANKTSEFTVTPGTSGRTYTISGLSDVSGYSRSVSATVNGSAAGSNSATLQGGQTLLYTVTYTQTPISCSINLTGPSSADVDEEMEFSWTSNNVSGSLLASGEGWTSSEPQNGSEDVDAPSSAGRYTYTLSGTSSTGTACSDSVTVTVNDRVVPATMSVTSNKTTRYTISGVTSNNSIRAGRTESRSVTPNRGGQTYTVSADRIDGSYPIITNNLSGDTGSAADVNLSGGENVTFTLTYPQDAMSVSLSSDKSSVQDGETFTLTWSSSNADECRDYQSSGQDRDWRRVNATSGSLVIDDISETETYQLRCERFSDGTEEFASQTVVFIEAQPDFTLSRTGDMDFSGITGDSDAATVYVSSLDGFNSDVVFTVSSADSALSDATFNFSQQTLRSSEYSTGLQITTTVNSSIPTGTYPITVQGVGGGLTRTIQLFVNIDNVDNRVIEEL